MVLLRHKADEIRRRTKKIAGVVDVQIEPEADAPKLEFEIDRESAARFGFTVAELNQASKMAIGEQVVSQIHSGIRSYDLVIKAGQSDADSKRISDTFVRAQSGELVPLSSLVSVRETSAVRAIYRENMARVVLVSCGVKGRERFEVEADIRKALASILSSLDGSYRLEYESR